MVTDRNNRVKNTVVTRAAIINVVNNIAFVLAYTVAPNGQLQIRGTMNIPVNATGNNSVGAFCMSKGATPVNFSVNTQGIPQFCFGAVTRFTKGAGVALARTMSTSTKAEDYLIADVATSKTSWVKHDDLVALQKARKGVPVVQNLMVDTIRDKVSVYPNEDIPAIRLVKSKGVAKHTLTKKETPKKKEEKSIYTPEQLVQLNLCKRNGGTVDIISNPKLSAEQMKVLRIGESKFGALTSVYNDPEFSVDCEKVLNYTITSPDAVADFSHFLTKPYPESKDGKRLMALLTSKVYGVYEPRLDTAPIEEISKVIDGDSDLVPTSLSKTIMDNVDKITASVKEDDIKDYHPAGLATGVLFDDLSTTDKLQTDINPKSILMGEALVDDRRSESYILGLINASCALLEQYAEDPYEEYLGNKIVNYFIYFNGYGKDSYTTAAWFQIMQYPKLVEYLQSEGMQASPEFLQALSNGRSCLTQYTDGLKLDPARVIASTTKEHWMADTDAFIMSLTDKEKSILENAMYGENTIPDDLKHKLSSYTEGMLASASTPNDAAFKLADLIKRAKYISGCLTRDDMLPLEPRLSAFMNSEDSVNALSEALVDVGLVPETPAK